MQQGIAAAGTLNITTPILEARRITLIKNAVAAYRSLKSESKLTERDAFVFVAALAATYDLEDDLNRLITDGQKAGQHFTR
jgi:hypothetical protein